MHIAVCDNNVADRKQLERLLGRESDARKNVTGVFYTDSYGEGGSLFPKRMSYDLFFIDINDDSAETGLDLALSLCKGGVSTPVVLCSSKIDYKERSLFIGDFPSNILFLNKPIVKSELSALLDRAVVLEAGREPTIELRDTSDTIYVREDDIVLVKQHGRYVDVSLADGRIVSVLDTISNFYSHIAMFDHFVVINNKAIINAVFVTEYSVFRVKLTNSETLKTLPRTYRKLRTTKENINDNK